MKRFSRAINLIVAGGSGLWAEINHYPSIIALKAKGFNVKVIAICDPIDPKSNQVNEKRENLKRILELDKPYWINPSVKNLQQLKKKLNNLLKKYPLCAMIVSANPVHHYFYSKWALDNKINVLCDKPLVTTENSSFDPKSAALVQERYKELNALFIKNRKENPYYIFCSPLRRRSLEPFMKIAHELEEVYKKTGEGIRHMNVIINGGIHKYPSEYLKGGAHGHLDGVGTLCHTSYHYIDLIAWYLKVARGKIHSIEISLPYVLRVSEYLDMKGYNSLRDLIEPNFKFQESIKIPQKVLNTELDFSFYLKLKDKKGNNIGQITFVVNYSTFAPRLTKYNPDVVEYAHDKYGGRMSSVYIDIHQGPLQQIQLIKNDEVVLGHNIELRKWLHPLLGEKQENWHYKHAYEKGILTSKGLFECFIKATMKLHLPKEELNLLSIIDGQNLTNRLYSAMYEKLAEEFYQKNHAQDVAPQPLNIEVEKYI